MYEVSKGASPPKRFRKGMRPKYPLKTMQVGDYFFVPDKPKNTLAPYISNTGKLLKCVFRTRLVYMRETLEGWVPCLSDAPGANLGVGIWRIA